MTSATKNPAPDRAGNTGLMWALSALVCSGTVDGGTGMRFRMDGRVVEGAAGAVGAGVVTTGYVVCEVTAAATAAMEGCEVAGTILAWDRAGATPTVSVTMSAATAAPSAA
jgi:hypothetical protein